MRSYGNENTTGTPRLRISILLELRPEILQEMADRNESLSNIGTRLSNAVTIDADDVLIVSMSQETYRDKPGPLVGAFPDMEKFYPLIERWLIKQLGEGDEPWKDVGDEPV